MISVNNPFNDLSRKTEADAYAVVHCFRESAVDKATIMDASSTEIVIKYEIGGL